MKKNKKDTVEIVEENLNKPAEEPEEAEKSEQSSEEEELLTRLEQAEKSAAENYDKLLRNMAEFDNFRKRTSKEKAGMYDDGFRDAIERILPVVDNFERAIQSSENKEDAFFKGIDMILRQLMSILMDAGVEPIESVGKKFDHNFHFAVAHVEDSEYGEQEIIEELQKGYICRGKVLRCSMVKVAN